MSMAKRDLQKYIYDHDVGMYYHEERNAYITEQEYEDLKKVKCSCGEMILPDEVCWCKK